MHYEKEHGGAVAKLRETEHKQNYVEGEIETMQKRAKELLKENRILQDEQRELELDIKVLFIFLPRSVKFVYIQAVERSFLHQTKFVSQLSKNKARLLNGRGELLSSA